MPEITLSIPLKKNENHDFAIFLNVILSDLLKYDINDLKLTRQSASIKDGDIQGYNARKVISEVYASFVLQCTVSGCVM